MYGSCSPMAYHVTSRQHDVEVAFLCCSPRQLPLIPLRLRSQRLLTLSFCVAKGRARCTYNERRQNRPRYLSRQSSAQSGMRSQASGGYTRILDR